MPLAIELLLPLDPSVGKSEVTLVKKYTKRIMSVGVPSCERRLKLFHIQWIKADGMVRKSCLANQTNRGKSPQSNYNVRQKKGFKNFCLSEV